MFNYTRIFLWRYKVLWLTMLVMYRHRFYGLLMRPSIVSGVICGLLALTIVVASNWSFVLENVLFYDYFFGPEGLVTVLEESSGSASAFRDALTKPSVSHNLTVIGVSALAVFGLYVIVRMILWLLSGLSMTLREIRAVESPQKTAVEHDLEKRTAIRLLVLVVWSVYAFLSLKVILPFCILASEVGLEPNEDSLDAVGYVLFACIVLFAALHVHVVLARLFILRPRIFGADAAVLSR